jgi:hypothetical protein
MYKCITIEEIDIDHMAVNMPLDNEATETVLKSFVGNAVQLQLKLADYGIGRIGTYSFYAGILLS